MEGMPEEHASRKERFAELDQLQPGWIVQLRSRGDAGTVDAHFVSPGGEPFLTVSQYLYLFSTIAATICHRLRLCQKKC